MAILYVLILAVVAVAVWPEVVSGTCDLSASAGMTISTVCDQDGVCHSVVSTTSVLSPNMAICMQVNGEVLSVSVPWAMSKHVASTDGQMICRPFVRHSSSPECFADLTEGIASRSGYAHMGIQKVCRTNPAGLQLCTPNQPYINAATYAQSCNNSGVFSYLKTCSNDCAGGYKRTKWFAWMCIDPTTYLVEKANFGQWEYFPEVNATGKLNASSVIVSVAGSESNEFWDWTFITDLSTGYPYARKDPVVPYDGNDYCASVMNPATKRFESISPVLTMQGDCNPVVGLTDLSVVFKEMQKANLARYIPMYGSSYYSQIHPGLMVTAVSSNVVVKITVPASKQDLVYGYFEKCKTEPLNVMFTQEACPRFGTVSVATPCSLVGTSPNCVMIATHRSESVQNWMTYAQLGTRSCTYCFSSGYDSSCYVTKVEFKTCPVAPGIQANLTTAPFGGGSHFNINLGLGSMLKAIIGGFSAITVLMLGIVLFLIIQGCLARNKG